MLGLQLIHVSKRGYGEFRDNYVNMIDVDHHMERKIAYYELITSSNLHARSKKMIIINTYTHVHMFITYMYIYIYIISM